MTMTANQLIERGNELFTKRLGLNQFWQHVADHFYLERADFTRTAFLGEQMGDGLTSSYPLIVRRKLASAFSAMLRPVNQPWFEVTIAREDKLDLAGRAWLQWATKVMRHAMYDRLSSFSRATKEGDNDYAAFGQTALSCELTPEKRLYYRCWHLRDCAWVENEVGQIEEMHRNWRPKLLELAQKFANEPDFKMHPTLASKIEREPWREVSCRHVQIPTSKYIPTQKEWRTKYVSIFLDVENHHPMLEVGTNNRIYTVPRWQTVSGSQYAYSPATVCGLPDARLIQAMSLSLMEAGQSAVRPPLIAQHEVLKSGMKLHPGGITFVDREYDERLGEAVRPMVQDKSGIPFGLELMHDSREMLAMAFYLDKLTPMPRTDREMTAYEVSQYVQDYIRDALPLFEPMEIEYNGGLCDQTFAIMMSEGAFGPYDMIPRSVRGDETVFQFESPLHRAIEKQKGTTFIQSKELINEAVQIDQNALLVLDVTTALREALEGIGTPAEWIREEEQVKQLAEANAQKQEQEHMLMQAQAGAAALKDAGAAKQSLEAVA